MLAADMAAQLAHLANLLSGDETAGAALQTLIFRQKIKYRTQDLLTGKKNKHSYEQECKHPLNLRQLALLQVISGLPYLVAAYEGSQGRTLGGSLGHQAFGAAGGIIGGLAHAKAQEVLAESLSRDAEFYASSATAVSSLPEHLQKSFKNLQEAYSCLDLSYEGVMAFKKVYEATFKIGKPLMKTMKERGQLQKAGDFIKNIRKKGLQEAIEESAKTTFSKATTAELNTNAVSSGLFAYNLYKFAKTFKLLPESLMSQLPEELDLEFLAKPIDWAKLPDKQPELILGLLKPVFRANTNVALEGFRNRLVKKTLEPIRKLSESSAYTYCAKVIQDRLTEQAQILLSGLQPLPI